jgi:hypothetical protein
MKLVACVLDVALLYVINGATIENTLFEDDDGANRFRAFNPTQTLLYLIFSIDLLRSADQYASYYIIT